MNLNSGRPVTRCRKSQPANSDVVKGKEEEKVIEQRILLDYEYLFGRVCLDGDEEKEDTSLQRRKEGSRTTEMAKSLNTDSVTKQPLMIQTEAQVKKINSNLSKSKRLWVEAVSVKPNALDTRKTSGLGHKKSKLYTKEQILQNDQFASTDCLGE